MKSNVAAIATAMSLLLPAGYTFASPTIDVGLSPGGSALALAYTCLVHWQSRRGGGPD